MDAIEILLIILIDFSAFFIGLALGLAVKKRRKYIKRRKQITKNKDLLSLLYYTPGEPTGKTVRKI